MSIKVDFNCDMGESFGMYKLGYDEEIIKYITTEQKILPTPKIKLMRNVLKFYSERIVKSFIK